MTADDDLSRSFVRTTLLLVGARLRRIAWLIVTLSLLFGGWMGWLIFGRVSVYATSNQTRLESSTFPFPIEVPVAGIVTECRLVLGAHVSENEILLQLDSKTFALQTDELASEITADDVAAAALQLELETSQKARDAVADLAHTTSEVGNARIAASHATSQFKEKERAIVRRLREAELTSELDSLRTEGEARTLRAQWAAAEAQAVLDSNNGLVNVRDRDTQIAGLKKSLGDALALKAVHEARLREAEYEIDRRRVRAVAAGELADITPCSAGMTLQPGTKLATLIPRADVRAVSLFRPEDAVGRLMVGQPAILRIDNFPWTQYGTLGAAVDRVGSEPRDGLVRVELRVTRTSPTIPVLHGLTGTAEIEVERLSPFKLLLRMAGQALADESAGGPRAPAPGSN
jgi:membrane fusion protein (multidrug efflux system)